MRSYEFFNKRRVSVQDMNNMQEWMFNNVRNYVGAYLEKGIIRQIPKNTLGDFEYGFLKQPQLVAFDQTNYIATPNQGLYFDIPVSSVGVTAMYFVDAGGRLYYIASNETYKTTPTEFQNQGNIQIPLSSGDGDYYIWIGYENLKDSVFTAVNKDGVVFYPKTHEGYRIIIRFNNSAQPPADVLYLGRINKVGTVLTFYDDVNNPATAPERNYAGIKQESVNIEVDSSASPSEYTDGTETTLKDHINALGDKLIRPENPHGVNSLHTGGMERDSFTENSRIISNGIVYKTGVGTNSQQQVLETARQITNKFNSGDLPADEHYIRLDRNANYEVHSDGRVFSLSNAEPFDSGISAVRLNFSGDGNGGGANPDEGWYRIYFDHDGLDDTDYVTLKSVFVSTLASDIRFDNVLDKGVTLGYVWWLNSGGNCELRVHEGYAGSNPDQIQPIIGLGTTNTSYEKIRPSETSRVANNKNLIPMAYFTGPSQWIETDTVDNIYNHFVGLNGVGGTNVYGINYGFQCSNIQTNEYVTLNFNLTANPPSSDKMVFNCAIYVTNYDPATDGYLEVIETGSGQSYFPPLQNNGTTQLNMDFNTGNLRLYFRGSWGASTLVSIFPKSAYYGTDSINYSQKVPATLTSKDIFNEQANDDFRTEIGNQSLEQTIIHKIPISGGLNIHGDGAGVGGDNSGRTDNWELWAFKADLRYLPGTTGKGEGSVTWDGSKYEIVSIATHTSLGTVENNYGFGTYPVAITPHLIGSGVVSFRSTVPFPKNTSERMYVTGIMIMRRISP